MSDINETIRTQVTSDPVVLYMKGTPVFPMCGFSAAVVQILSQTGVKFQTYNVLDDADLRQGLKEFSNWPTFPQLYVDGELVGGCDIVREMYQSGELNQLFEDKALAKA
jgi:monothiol glutaredoxin